MKKIAELTRENEELRAGQKALQEQIEKRNARIEKLLKKISKLKGE